MSDRKARVLIVVASLAIALAIAGSVLAGDRIIGYRDASLFYYPLMTLVRGEWLNGRIPLWNPWINAGQPLAASASAAIFYPAQLLFLLPLPVAWTFNIYLLGHLGLAALGAYRLARDQGASILAAGLGCLSYAFSGSVLFQTCNVVFLCGASWLPWALLFGLRLMAPRSPQGDSTDAPVASNDRELQGRNVLKLAGVLAMMVLSGDPQAAYHTGIILGLFGIVRAIKHAGRESGSLMTRSRSLAVTGGLILVSSMIAGGLTCAQLALTSEFSARSGRNSDVTPLSVWSVPSFLMNSDRLEPRIDNGLPPRWWDTILGNPAPPAKQYSQIYGFSLEPSRMLELIWPQWAGPQLPETHRWPIEVRLERRTYWTLSIYGGLLPFLLALAVFGRKLDHTWIGWNCVVCFSLFAAFGDCGPGWIVRVAKELWYLGEADWDRYVGDEVGGVYWMLVTFLPGYSTFRYPAKWTPVFALAMAQLAAYGLDQVMVSETARRRLRNATMICGGTLLVGLIGAILVRLTMHAMFAGNAESLRVWWVVVGSAATSLVALSASWFGILRWNRGWVLTLPVLGTATVPATVLLVTAADLAWSNSQLILMVPVSTLSSARDLVERLQSDRVSTPAGSASQQLRIHRLLFWEAGDKHASAQIDMDARTLSTNVPYLYPVSAIDERGSLELNDFTIFFDILPAPNGTFLRPRRSYDLWGVEYFLLPTGYWPADPDLTTEGLEREWSESQRRGIFEGPVPNGQLLPHFQVPLSADAGSSNHFRVLKNTSALPRVRIAHSVTVRPPVNDYDHEEWIHAMLPLCFGGEGTPDLATTALVESEELARSTSKLDAGTGTAMPDGESCRIVSDDPQRVVIEARLAKPGLVILADTFYPGWTLEVASDDRPAAPTSVLRTNRLQRGCWLPAGRHRLIYSYWPPWFTPILMVNIAAVVGWSGLLLRRRHNSV